MTGGLLQPNLEGLSALDAKELPPMMSVRVDRLRRELLELFRPWWAQLLPLIRKYSPGADHLPLNHPRRAEFEADPEVVALMEMPLELDGPPLAFEDILEEGVRLKPAHLRAMIAAGVVAPRSVESLPPEVVALFEELGLDLDAAIEEVDPEEKPAAKRRKG